jgi:hypothetical protein
MYPGVSPTCNPSRQPVKQDQPSAELEQQQQRADGAPGSCTWQRAREYLEVQCIRQSEH